MRRGPARPNRSTISARTLEELPDTRIASEIAAEDTLAEPR